MIRLRHSLATLHPLWAVAFLAAQTPLAAQTVPQPSEPYAAINRSAISYAGPGRDKAHDLPGPEIKIGIILPRSGARKAEGDALLAAAQLAIEDESAAPLSNGLRLVLAARDESGLWGRASNEIVKLVVDDRAVALITSPDGRAAHLSEQVGNRLGVPVLTLASDSTTTQINIPWFFRLVADDAAQARLFAEDIYQKRALERVALVFENDHDGRIGRDEYLKAARQMEAPEPALIEIPSLAPDFGSLAARITAQGPQAVVLWAAPRSAVQLLAKLQPTEAGPRLYVCHKAVQEQVEDVAGKYLLGGAWVAANATSGSPEAQMSFEDRYRAKTGASPSPAARAMYDAVRMVAAGVREAGPNRARLRDSLAALGEYRGVSGAIAFDGAGNNRAEVTLIELK